MKKLPNQKPRLAYGWAPDLPDNRDHQYAAPMAKLRALPAKADLRNLCPPVYNQGQIGSCTANAIAATLEFDRKKQKLADFIPSRLFIYYNERSMEHSVPLDNGAQIRDGIKSVGNQGAQKKNGLTTTLRLTRPRTSGRPELNRRKNHRSPATRTQRNSSPLTTSVSFAAWRR